MNNSPILEFKGEFAFLSNFYPCRIEYNGLWFPTVEHAYQAAKCVDMEDARRIQRLLTPGQAKRMGKMVKLLPFWEDHKLEIMFYLLKQKFGHTSPLKYKLIETQPRQLIEGNNWGDIYWGVCNGVGENWLGKLLMYVRTLP